MRYWRSLRRINQLDLSLETGVSQRHISFIENGRSQPSRQMVLDLAEALEIPLREQNTLLLAAGYAPVFLESGWDAPEMKQVRKALERLLQHHEPYPAVVMDRYWNVVLTNEAAPQFFNSFVDLSKRTGPRNILHLMFDPKGMRPFVLNWEEVAEGLIQRVYRESVGRAIDPKTQKLLEDLEKYPDVKTDWKTPKPPSAMPVIPITFQKDKRTFQYFSMVTTVGLPHCVTAQELRVECMFPADETTEQNPS